MSKEKAKKIPKKTQIDADIQVIDKSNIVVASVTSSSEAVEKQEATTKVKSTIRQHPQKPIKINGERIIPVEKIEVITDTNIATENSQPTIDIVSTEKEIPILDTKRNNNRNKKKKVKIDPPKEQLPELNTEQDATNTQEIVRGKNYYKNKKRKENLKRKLEQQKKLNEVIVVNAESHDVVPEDINLNLSETENLTELAETSARVEPISSNNIKPKIQITNKKSDIPKQVVQEKVKPAAKKKGEKKQPVPKTDEPVKPKKTTTPRIETLYSILPESKQLTKSQLSNEFLTEFHNTVEDYLRQQAYIEPGGKILVAVSGGVDSIVMMDTLAILASKMRFSLYVSHFNHKLRGLSSDNDEVLVRNTCKDYNLHFYSGAGNVKQYSSKNSISIEHAARILRYNFFERTARNLGVDIVATAHTEDDLVETFFINLFRGSGLTGLSSMPSKRKFVKNVTLVRPFLQINKSQLYEYAKIRKLKWNEDETNSLLNYTRNKIRHDLLPKLINDYNPSIINTITRTAELIQGADEVIKDLVSKSLPSVIEESSNERFNIKINMLLTFNRFMQGELLQFAWNKYFRLQPLSLAVIDRILELNLKQTGSICEISSGYFVLRDRNHLIFAKRIKEIATSIIIEKPGAYKIGKYKLEITPVKYEEVKFSDDKFTEYISADLMEPFTEIRNKRDGDLFTPLGAPGEMKLSDFLTNEKVSLIDKSNVMVLTNRIDILWVIGYRISDKCKVNKKTERIYRLKLINTEK